MRLKKSQNKLSTYDIDNTGHSTESIVNVLIVWNNKVVKISEHNKNCRFSILQNKKQAHSFKIKGEEQCFAKIVVQKSLN